MKRIITIIILFSFFPVIYAQRPYYDRANHYQWRSMEKGKWSFSPKWYYYPWSWRHPNYMGFHANYVKKYGNSNPFRNDFFATLTINQNLAKNQAEDMENQAQQELINLSDRELNIAKSSISDKYEKIQSNINKHILLFESYGGSLQIISRLLLESNRIKENYETVNSAHLENSKREDAYLLIIKDAEELNYMALSFAKMQYNKQKNKEIFKIINKK